MKSIPWYSLVLGIITFLATRVAGDDANRIQPWSENPRYWQYQGPACAVAGRKQGRQPVPDSRPQGAPRRNPCRRRQLHPQHDERPEGQGLRGLSLQAVARRQIRPRQWNEEYWRRFENLLRWTAERDIIVQIEVWDRFDYSTKNWEPHPYNPKNNVNYTYAAVGLCRALPRPPRPEQAAVLLHHAPAAQQHRRVEIPAAVCGKDALLHAPPRPCALLHGQ